METENTPGRKLTAEEILKQWPHKEFLHGEIMHAHSYVLKAMEEYADQSQQEESIEDYISKITTDGRPLSDPPLIIEQPVSCPDCGKKEYADWKLLPHQVYNSYIENGAGHYCFDCFAKIVYKKQPEQREPLKKLRQKFNEFSAWLWNENSDAEDHTILSQLHDVILNVLNEQENKPKQRDPADNNTTI